MLRLCSVNREWRKIRKYLHPSLFFLEKIHITALNTNERILYKSFFESYLLNELFELYNSEKTSMRVLGIATTPSILYNVIASTSIYRKTEWNNIAFEFIKEKIVKHSLNRKKIVGLLKMVRHDHYYSLSCLNFDTGPLYKLCV